MPVDRQWLDCLLFISLYEFSFLRVLRSYVKKEEKSYPKEDDNGADEHANALEKVSNHVHERCPHTCVGLLSPPTCCGEKVHAHKGVMSPERLYANET